jgi:LacI family transcriptional regulator
LTITTIKDIARIAGVSTTTVSHVVNKTRFVSEDLRERVIRVIKELNYQPYGLARSLRKKQSGTIGIVIPDNTNQFFAEVVRGIEDKCFKNGYSVFLCNSDGEPAKERNYLKLLIEKGVDGLVLVSAGDDKEAMGLLENRAIPKVIVDRDISGLHMDSVLVDNQQGGYEAANFLIKLGHKKIGCITGPSNVTPSWQRVKGFKKALQENDLPVDESMIATGDFKSRGGSEGLKRLMQGNVIPTAIFVCNDMMAIGALNAAHELGVNVPERLSLVGFDDIALASLIIPNLTTVAQPKYKLGETGAELLLKRINDRERSESRIVLETQLVKRATCTPPGKN